MDGRIHVGIDHEGMQVMVRGTAVSAVTVGGAIQTVIADEYEAKYPYRPSGPTLADHPRTCPGVENRYHRLVRPQPRLQFVFLR